MADRYRRAQEQLGQVATDLPEELRSQATRALDLLSDGDPEAAHGWAEDLAIELSTAHGLHPDAWTAVADVVELAGVPRPKPPNPQMMAVTELVAWNLRRARMLRGWTQEEVADRLEPLLGVRWSSVTMSTAERGYLPKNRTRGFTPEEIVAFARVFDVPVTWFFLPPDVEDAGFETAKITSDPDNKSPGLNPPDQVRMVLGASEDLAKTLGDRLERTLKVLPKDQASELLEVLGETTQLDAQVRGRVRRAVSSLRELADLLEDLLEDQD